MKSLLKIVKHNKNQIEIIQEKNNPVYWQKKIEIKYEAI